MPVRPHAAPAPAAPARPLDALAAGASLTEVFRLGIEHRAAAPSAVDLSGLAGPAREREAPKSVLATRILNAHQRATLQRVKIELLE